MITYNVIPQLALSGLVSSVIIGVACVKIIGVQGDAYWILNFFQSVVVAMILCLHQTRHPKLVARGIENDEEDEVLWYKWYHFTISLTISWLAMALTVKAYEFPLWMACVPPLLALLATKAAMVWYRPGAVEGFMLLGGAIAALLLAESANIPMLATLFPFVLSFAYKELCNHVKIN